jgi:RHS repeat-associated protein
VTTVYRYEQPGGAPDKTDRLSAAGAAAVTTNENGNLTGRLGGGVDDTFAYDQADRLVRATVTENGTPVTTTFVYDGDGGRVSKTSGAATTRYVRDVNRGLPVLLDDGTRSFVWGVPVGNQRLLYAVDRAGNVLVYHANGRGSVVALTDATKAVVQTYVTDEFGAPTVLQGSVGTGQPFLFAGEPYDDETNLLYLRARYYDPGLGRLLTRDRRVGGLWAPPTLHRYVYAGNNPSSWADPSGRELKSFDEFRSCLDRARVLDQGPLGFLVCMGIGPGPRVGPAQTLTVFPVEDLSGPGGLGDEAAERGVRAMTGTGGGGTGGAPRRATVEELIAMMNSRANTLARFAEEGDEAAYYRYLGAEGGHWRDFDTRVFNIRLLEEKASRRTAFHEWPHRYIELQGVHFGDVAAEERFIEEFLTRNSQILGMD